MSSLALLSIGQPLGLVALVMPIAFLLAARERGKAQPRLVGSLEIWRRVSGEREVVSRSRKAPLTPRILVIAAAMALGALALTAPKWAHKSPPQIWRVVLDTSAANAIGADGRRFDLAVDAGVDWTADKIPGARVFWIGAEREDGREEIEERAAGERPSAAFLERIAGAGIPRRWSRFDAADCLWLPTGGGGKVPRLAGLAQLDFEPAPGPAALLGDGKCLWWQPGAELTERALPAGAPRGALLLLGPALESGQPLGDLARAWAAERDLEVGRAQAAPGDVLVINSVMASVAGDSPRHLTIGRDGWNARATLGAAPSRNSTLEPWLAQRGETFVAWRPGEIDLGFSALTEPTGDPAAFAVSWATLFESAALAGPGIVSVAERQGASIEAKLPAGLASSTSESDSERQDAETPLAPVLAVLAAALLFGATRR